MQVEVLAFGIAKEIFGSSTIEVELKESNTDNLKSVLEEKYPKLKELTSYMIALNDEYVRDTMSISERDEIAIIPPVSGG